MWLVEGLRREGGEKQVYWQPGAGKLETTVEYTTRTRSGGKHDSEVETYFEIAELRELLAAVIETAEVRLGLIVDDFVGADISALGESLSTDFAMIWTLSSMPSFMSLQFPLV